MTTLSRVQNEFVYGGHMLAVGTASIAASFALILGVTPTPLLLLVAYLFSYGAYSINRSSEMEQDALSNPTRTHLLAGRRRYLPIIAMGCFALGYALAATVSTVSFTALLLPLLLALAYSVGSKKLVPYLGVRRLKEKLLLKNLIVAFSWSLIPLLVAVYYFDLKYAIVTFGLFVFLRLMLNTIIFDVRDVAADRRFGVRTIPVVFGKSFSFRLMSLIDLATISYLVVALAVGLLPAYASIMIVLPLYSSVYRYLARRPEADLGKICDVIADGEYLLWGPIVFLGRILI